MRNTEYEYGLRDGNPNEASAGESSEKIPEKRRGDEGADKAVHEQV